MKLDGMVLQDHEKLGTIYSIVYSPDGKFILTNSAIARSALLKEPTEWAACIWDATTCRFVRALAHADSIKSVLYSPKGTLVLTTCQNHPPGIWATTTGELVRIWHAATGRLVRTLEHPGELHSLVCSPDERFILTAALVEYLYGTPCSWSACVWDVASGERVRMLKHPRAVHTAIYSPDGSRILTTTNDRAVHIWDACTGALVRPKIEKFD